MTFSYRHDAAEFTSAIAHISLEFWGCGCQMNGRGEEKGKKGSLLTLSPVFYFVP
jgi:hypothetical protein